MLSSYRYGGTVLSGFAERPTVAVGDPFRLPGLNGSQLLFICAGFQAAPSIHGLRLFINHLKLHLCIDDTEVTPFTVILTLVHHIKIRSISASRFQVQITDGFCFLSARYRGVL
jgi:hypothetical protein